MGSGIVTGLTTLAGAAIGGFIGGIPGAMAGAAIGGAVGAVGEGALAPDIPNIPTPPKIEYPTIEYPPMPPIQIMPSVIQPQIPEEVANLPTAEEQAIIARRQRMRAARATGKRANVRTSSLGAPATGNVAKKTLLGG